MKIKNPIYWRELHYQKYAVSRLVQIIDSVGIVVLTLCLACILVAVMVNRVERYTSNWLLPNWELMKSAQLMSWAIHVLCVGRAIIAGMDVIRRDQNWDDLILANISSGRFLFGKWRAAIYQMRGWLLALGLIQLTLIGVMLTSHLLTVYQDSIVRCYHDATVHRFYSCDTNDRNLLYAQTMITVLTPLSIISAILLSILEVLASTAVGIACSILFHGNVLSFTGFFVRFFPIVVFTLWPSSYPEYSIFYGANWAIRWFDYTWFSLADGGTTAILRMVVAPGFFYQRDATSIPSALFAGFGLLGLLVIGSIAVGWIALRINRFE